MATTYYCGKLGSLKIATVSYPITNWELSSEITYPEISNFTIPGQQAYCPNLIGGTITCEGFLTSQGTPTNDPLIDYPVAGSWGEFFLGYTTGVGYTVGGLIVNITPSQDVQDVARFSIEAVICPDPTTLP